MIRFLLRSLGLWILAAGFLFFVYDGPHWIANRKFSFTSVGFVWAQVHQNSLLLLQPAIERHVAVWLWQLVIQPILEQPIWVVCTVLGTILILLGRKKKPLIGYAR
jgi:hypothetical protein